MKPYISVLLAVVVLGAEAHQVATGIMSHSNTTAVSVWNPESTEVDVSTFSALSNAIASNTAVNVVSDITFTAPITISGLTDLAIGSTNGATLTSNRNFSNSYGGMFQIDGESDVTFSGLGFASGSAYEGGCLHAQDSSNVKVEGSNFTACYAVGSN